MRIAQTRKSIGVHARAADACRDSAEATATTAAPTATGTSHYAARERSISGTPPVIIDYITDSQWYTKNIMFNWYTDQLGRVGQIVDRLSSGRRLSQLVVALIAAGISYATIDYLTILTAKYISSEASAIDGILFVILLVALPITVGVAFTSFARWFSYHEDQTDEILIAEAQRDAKQKIDNPEDLIKHIK